MSEKCNDGNHNFEGNWNFLGMGYVPTLFDECTKCGEKRYGVSRVVVYDEDHPEDVGKSYVEVLPESEIEMLQNMSLTDLVKRIVDGSDKV